MTNREDKTDRPRDVVFTAVFALIAVAVACATFLCTLPRSVPLELPVLVLDEGKARAQITEDERLSALKQSELARNFYQALRDAGKSELERNEARAYALERRILALKERAKTQLDAQGLRAVRAYATQRSMLALFAQLDDENEERELIGAQRSLFATYGYISPDGSLLAPKLAVRAMFKVRWNMIFGEPATAGLYPIELYAYEGFRALEAVGMPNGIRYDALYELIRAGGGVRAERALAILQAAEGKAGPLIARVQNADNEAAQIRLRNMALAALPRPEAE